MRSDSLLHFKCSACSTNTNNRKTSILQVIHPPIIGKKQGLQKTSNSISGCQHYICHARLFSCGATFSAVAQMHTIQPTKQEKSNHNTTCHYLGTFNSNCEVSDWATLRFLQTISFHILHCSIAISYREKYRLDAREDEFDLGVHFRTSQNR